MERAAGMGWGMAFVLDERLAKGGVELGRMDGCRLLLKNNAMFPWLILVPEVEGAEDLHHLPVERFDEVMAAVRRVSEFVEGHFLPEKLNVACIGNMVRQMHIHVVGRSPGDAAWPGTVWAFEGKAMYEPAEVEVVREAARAFFGGCLK